MACLFAARLAACGAQVAMLGAWAEGLQALQQHGVRLKVPGLVVRSHRHTFADTGNIYPVRVCTSGAWQAVPEYAYKADFTAPPDIGGLIVTVGDNGEWTIIQKRYQMRMSKIQTLPPINGKST